VVTLLGTKKSMGFDFQFKNRIRLAGEELVENENAETDFKSKMASFQLKNKIWCPDFLSDWHLSKKQRIYRRITLFEA
jgi:hypothetical protein